MRAASCLSMATRALPPPAGSSPPTAPPCTVAWLHRSTSLSRGTAERGRSSRHFRRTGLHRNTRVCRGTNQCCLTSPCTWCPSQIPGLQEHGTRPWRAASFRRCLRRMPCTIRQPSLPTKQLDQPKCSSLQPIPKVPEQDYLLSSTSPAAAGAWWCRCWGD